MVPALPLLVTLAFLGLAMVSPQAPWAVCPSLPHCWNTGPFLQISKNEASLRIATQHMHPADLHSHRAYDHARLL